MKGSIFLKIYAPVQTNNDEDQGTSLRNSIKLTKNGEVLIGNQYINRYLQCFAITHPWLHTVKEHPETAGAPYIINELSSQRLQEGFWFTALHTLISPTSTNNSR